jgi:hypothetical protein
MTDFRQLEEIFMQASSLLRRREAARSLAQQFPAQAWTLFMGTLHTAKLPETLAGLSVLGDSRAIPMLTRVFCTRGTDHTELLSILQTLAQLQAIDALCQIAEDLYCPANWRLEALHLLSLLPSLESRALFLRELDAPSRQRQLLGIQTLGRWQVEEAVPHLARLLSCQRHTAHCRPICIALAQIANPNALQLLHQYLLTAVSPNRIELAEIMASIPNPAFPQLLADWIPLYDTSEIPHIQRLIDKLSSDIYSQQQQKYSNIRQNLENALFETDNY